MKTIAYISGERKYFMKIQPSRRRLWMVHDCQPPQKGTSTPASHFFDQGERITEVNILKEVPSISIVYNELQTKFNNLCRWISSGRLSPFNAQDQLFSIDFVPINSDFAHNSPLH